MAEGECWRSGPEPGKGGIPLKPAEIWFLSETTAPLEVLVEIRSECSFPDKDESAISK